MYFTSTSLLHTTPNIIHATLHATLHTTCHTTHYMPHYTLHATLHITCHTTHYMSHYITTCHTTHYMSHYTSQIKFTYSTCAVYSKDASVQFTVKMLQVTFSTSTRTIACDPCAAVMSYVLSLRTLMLVDDICDLQVIPIVLEIVATYKGNDIFVFNMNDSYNRRYSGHLNNETS